MSLQQSGPIYASSFLEGLPGSTSPPESRFPGSPITMSQNYPQRSMSPTTQTTFPQTAVSQNITKTNKKATDEQIMNKLGEVFGQKPMISYWPLLTFITAWVIFGLVIFIIFLAAGKVGWGFYYLTTIIVMGVVFGLIIWVICKDGYSTAAWVISGLFIFIALGFVIWASVAYPQIKDLGQSPFGTKS